ncbi:MAG: hypothetical protein U0Q12_24470 [Vicinamibacterales bacterium]
MADTLLIVHGYSDGSTSFTGLGDFFIASGAYKADNVFYLDYSSMDDEATFHDFADKLDSDHRDRLGGARIDVACHSTGSLVVRAWLALHEERARRRRLDEPCPVHRLFCFAPANFGSDLASMGQSFLGKFRSTFFNSNAHREDFLESGKVVLQGLEPASPFQWMLSVDYDLHGASYFNFSPQWPEEKRCYPFVFAAGEAYTGIQAKLIRQRALPGTDGTVRIAGTSLNTRGCSLDFRRDHARLVWWPDTRGARIPFAVFAGFNHGSIIEPKTAGFDAPLGPGTLAHTIATSSTTLATYAELAETFDRTSEDNYARLPADRQDRYQQFFFRVRDDVNLEVDDYFIDFHVAHRDGTPHEALTVRFDEDFETQVYRHSAAPTYRVFMMNCSKLHSFHQALRQEDALLMLEVTGVSKLPDVRYPTRAFIAFDPAADVGPGEPYLLEPNTTTFVDVILDRQETDKLLVIRDYRRTVVVSVSAPAPEVTTGRAALVEQAKP